MTGVLNNQRNIYSLVFSFKKYFKCHTSMLLQNYARCISFRYLFWFINGRVIIWKLDLIWTLNMIFKVYWFQNFNHKIMLSRYWFRGFYVLFKKIKIFLDSSYPEQKFWQDIFKSMFYSRYFMWQPMRISFYVHVLCMEWKLTVLLRILTGRLLFNTCTFVDILCEYCCV